jgi:hypothetical protein
VVVYAQIHQDGAPSAVLMISDRTPL